MHCSYPLVRQDGQIINKLSNHLRDQRVSQAIALYETLYFLPNLPEDAELIWVADNKSVPYWRTVEYGRWSDANPDMFVKKRKKKVADQDKPDQVKVDEPVETLKIGRGGYKGNRDTCTYQQWVAKRFHNFSTAWSIPGYEADDIAAAIVSHYERIGVDREIVLVTVDSDWLQLVTKSVNWCCARGFAPQWRSVESLADWFGKKLEKESKATRMAIDPSQPLDIIKWKQLTGDKSDNLVKGSPVGFFDLREPLEGYKLVDQIDVEQELKVRSKRVVRDKMVLIEWIDQYGSLPTPIVY